MSRPIRLNSFPWVGPEAPIHYRAFVSLILGALNDHKANFMLGVTPMVTPDEDIPFLNNNVGCGRVIMQGFDHHFSYGAWPDVGRTFHTGGEFSGMSEKDISQEYEASHAKLGSCSVYDPEHFVAPFNCYTQRLLNVLNDAGVRYIHTRDLEFEKYGYSHLNHHNIEPVLTKHQVTEGPVSLVLRHLEENSDAQICLNIVRDMEEPGWEKKYEELCEKTK